MCCGKEQTMQEKLNAVKLRDIARKSKVNEIFFDTIILGQEAICPDGLGRVTSYNYEFPNQSVTIRAYADNMERSWTPDKIKLIDPRR